ncbi:unnamed protein product [Rangifer tarandus platyrhynchus]|uniref:Uncharacterized protein n=1 Tax=Rangifer tarandus platyrhynchus TaxID=3082113 RepID=A0ACB1KHQ1_RANTA
MTLLPPAAAAAAAKAGVGLGATGRRFYLHFETGLASPNSSSIWDREPICYFNRIREVRTQQEDDCLPTPRELSPEPDTCGTLILDFQLPESNNEGMVDMVEWLVDSAGEGVVEIDTGMMMLVAELATSVVELTMLMVVEDVMKVEEVKIVSWPHF